MPGRREALIDVVITEVDRYLTDLVRRIANTSRAASARVLAILHEFSTTVDTAPDRIKIWLISNSNVDDSTWTRYVDFQDQILAAFSDII